MHLDCLMMADSKDYFDPSYYLPNLPVNDPNFVDIDCSSIQMTSYKKEPQEDPGNNYQPNLVGVSVTKTSISK